MTPRVAALWRPRSLRPKTSKLNAIFSIALCLYNTRARGKKFQQNGKNGEFHLQNANFDITGDIKNVDESRITAPASGTIIALDPDIPPNRQRVSFTAEGINLRWLVDGKPFADSIQTRNF